MDLNLSVLQEPRGVMRLFHFVFAIVAFATTVDFSATLNVKCGAAEHDFVIDYPFDIANKKALSDNCTVILYGNFSSDAKFYVCTGVLSMLYALAILVVYTKFDQMYRSNENIPLGDFVLSVVLAIFWLSSSAAWANGLSGLKQATSNLKYLNCECTAHSLSFSSLNISIVVGFLNFFLWASNLWFLYKETKWFQKPAPSSPAI